VPLAVRQRRQAPEVPADESIPLGYGPASSSSDAARGSPDVDAGGREYGDDLPAVDVLAWAGLDAAAERGDAFGEADESEATAPGRLRETGAAR
jgi:hypothetical protein